MPESSVDSYINAQPEQAMSYDQFWRENNSYGTSSPEGQFWNKFLNFFTGEDKRVQGEYEAYLNNLNARNEYLATQSARAYDRLMDDTKVQRMMADYEAAGLNPYLLVNNGGVSVGSAPTSSKADYSYSHKTNEKVSKGRDIALLLIGVARLAAALL